MNRTKGFTTAEILVALGILALITGLSVSAFVALNRREGLQTSAETVKAVLSEARSKTLSAAYSTNWGVHFASSSVTLFRGSTYSSSASTNVLTTINSRVVISNVSKVGSCSSSSCTVVFNRLTGETDQASPTATVTLRDSQNSTQVITIYGTGIVE